MGSITVNSLSGGRTSAYLAAHYPADVEIFSLVCVDDHNCGAHFRYDWKVKQQVNDRLQKFCGYWPEFRATTEDPVILRTMLDLEQYLGREVIWVRGMSWEQMLAYKQAVPNMSKRFCTTILKLWPIFYYLYTHHDIPVRMRIGYRYDEMERRDSFTTSIKVPEYSQLYPNQNKWVQRWKEYEWRVGEFPLIDDKVHHFRVRGYWEGKPIRFPEDSNCQNCFWKHPQQLRKNFETNRPIMLWAAVTEQMMGRTFRDDYSLLQIAKMGIQQDFFFGTGSGCQAGGCTD